MYKRKRIEHEDNRLNDRKVKKIVEREEIEEFVDHKSETDDIKLLQTITFNEKVNAASWKLVRTWMQMCRRRVISKQSSSLSFFISSSFLLSFSFSYATIFIILNIYIDNIYYSFILLLEFLILNIYIFFFQKFKHNLNFFLKKR